MWRFAISHARSVAQYQAAGERRGSLRKSRSPAGTTASMKARGVKLQPLAGSLPITPWHCQIYGSSLPKEALCPEHLAVNVSLRERLHYQYGIQEKRFRRSSVSGPAMWIDLQPPLHTAHGLPGRWFASATAFRNGLYAI